MEKLNVGLIYGGVSNEHEVSILSSKNIIDNLDKNKYNIYKIYIDKKGVWYSDNNIIDNVFNYLKQIDIVFPIIHGTNGEDGRLQGLLDILNIKYVGSKVLSSSLCMDKVYTKMIFNKANLNQAKYIYLKKDKDKYMYFNNDLSYELLNIDEVCNKITTIIPFPLFVKPSNSGSSIGISKVYNKKELKNAIDKSSIYDNKILIEEYICGREIECSVLGNNEVIVSYPGEIITKEDFYSYDAKYKNKSSKIIIPSKIDKDITDKIMSIAKKAYISLDCKALARVDFLLENDTNKIYINEINTLPGFTDISMYPKLWEYSKISISNLLDKIISLSLE